MLQFMLAIDLGIMVLIWLVQIIIYPTFMHITPDRFSAYHNRYTGRISFFVVPLMFGQLGFHGYALTRSQDVLHVLGAILIGLAWLATFGLSVPCHHRLASKGYDPMVIKQLVHTNWIRTVAWTGVVILDILPVLRSAGLV
ncbi:MAG TPA: hypothetical protein DCM28_02480 [Phycisphaerales bacterium]|nr:hypothetical protein [Phycisphaerales bacterium]HCD32835.1 hypothetical protein [Phycisphaerales bacterium]|tara:strand:+ start:3392 stop:3814 length:423 start_codon:yes stop_codon:yes gene_type:complete